MKSFTEQEQEQRLIHTKDIDLLWMFYNHNDYRFREAVASNDNCPIDLLEKLSNDIFYTVIIKVFNNKNCTKDLIMKFSDSKDVNIKLGIIKSVNCPVCIYYKFYLDSNDSIRRAIANNSNCPVDILEKFIDDEHCDMTLDMTLDIIYNKNCPDYLIEKIYNKYSSNDYIKLAIVENNKTSYELLKKIYKEDLIVFTERLRDKIIKNPNWNLKDFQ